VNVDVKRAAPALVAPLNQNSLGTVRSLSRVGIPSVAVMPRPRDISAYTRLPKRKISFDRSDREAMWDALVAFGTATAEPHVTFWGDDDAVVSAAARASSLPPSLRFVLPDPQVVDLLTNKVLFAEWATSHGFRVPRTRVCAEPADWERVLDESLVPCVVKPDERTAAWEASGRAKTFFASTKGELARLQDEYAGAARAFVVQEWIPGPDSNLVFHLAYYSAEGKHLAGFSGRKLRQWPNDIGYTSAAEPIDDGEVEHEARRVLEAAGHCGLGSVEFKRDARDGALVIMEPTCGRTNGQEEIAAVNGVNLVHVAYCDLLGVELPSTTPRAEPVRLFFVAHDVQSAAVLRQRGELTWGEFLRSYRVARCIPPWSLRDPLPFTLLVLRRLVRPFRRSRRPAAGREERELPRERTRALER
jgi:D-aspartate ligase